MDQDRWNRAFSTWSTTGAGTSSTGAMEMATSGNVTSSPQEERVNRYKFDMEQAHAMQRASARPQPSHPDVTLGFRGLDEAETLQRQGNLQAALTLYQQSMELLLRWMREASSPTATPTLLDKQQVANRVQVALAEAERIKKILQQQGNSTSPEKRQNHQQQQQQRASKPANKSATGSWSSLSSSLTSALARPSPNRTASASTLKAPTLTRNTNVARHDTITPASIRKSRLDYNQDPLVQTILSDLYVDPSQLQNVTWNDIAGLARAKQSLQEAAIFPLLRPDLYTGLRQAQNVLLYGPPGTGKTLLVKAVAHESQCLLFVCTASALTSKWLGEGEKLVRTLFLVARDVAPSLIFIDEIDALLSSRSSGEHEASRRFKTEFMTQMDGITSTSASSVLLVACTNCPWDVDDAVMRRFPRRIHVPLPDAEARRALWKHLLQQAGQHTLRSAQVEKLVQRTEGFSCADLRNIASEAAFGPLRSLGADIRNVRPQNVRPVNYADFDAALMQATKSVTPGLLAKYKTWEQQQQSAF